jgi:hypothetical protein
MRPGANGRGLLHQALRKHILVTLLHMLSHYGSQDPEYVKLRVVPHIDEMFHAFFEFVQNKFKTIAAFALTQYDVRHEEQQQFFAALNEVRHLESVIFNSYTFGVRPNPNIHFGFFRIESYFDAKMLSRCLL